MKPQGVVTLYYRVQIWLVCLSDPGPVFICIGKLVILSQGLRLQGPESGFVSDPRSLLGLWATWMPEMKKNRVGGSVVVGIDNADDWLVHYIVRTEARIIGYQSFLAIFWSFSTKCCFGSDNMCLLVYAHYNF